MSSHTFGPSATATTSVSQVGLVQHRVLRANGAMTSVDVAPASQIWEPVPALRSQAQERLAIELITTLHTWITRIRPGLWRNPLGEPYPK